MSDLATDNGYEADSEAGKGNPPISEADCLLVKRIQKRIEADKAHWKAPFEQMRQDMATARLGATKEWIDGGNYTANLTGQHIKQTVATLYAKNPKSVARRRERLDFQIWDENEQTLIAAAELTQQYQMSIAPVPGAPVQIDMMTGMPVPPPPPPPEVQQAMAIVADFQAGMQERQVIDKVGKTLEVLFNYFMKEQKPVEFKTSMKQAVRRTCAAGVAYVEIGFQRKYGEANSDVTGQIADVREQLNRIKVLQADDQDDGNSQDFIARQRELELSLQSLQGQEYALVREGLVYDFPTATQVIADKRTRNLTGFVGARWLTIQYLYTPDEVKGLFDIDLGRGYTGYTQDGKSLSEDDQRVLDFDDDGSRIDSDGLACVSKHYDRAAGLVYYVCDGYKGFLRPPGPPDVYVEGFWPVHALAFNEVEDPTTPIPRSDVSLIRDMQDEHNRSRQGKREHRQAARPRFGTPKGALDDEDRRRLANSNPFDVLEFNMIGDQFDMSKVLQAIQVPGVDPNLYDTNETQGDLFLVVGTSPSQMGGASKGDTATGEALAEDSRSVSAGAAVDDLDSFLTAIARDSGQIMLREMSPESVKKIAGRGAVWPPMTLEDLAGEVYLEVEAGSSGKPNAAQEIRNWREMLPFLIQMPGIQPTWLARESLRRLDDRMDLTDALADGIPSIAMMNRQAGGAQQMGADGQDPAQQGAEGSGNGAPAAVNPAGGERGMGGPSVM